MILHSNATSYFSLPEQKAWRHGEAIGTFCFEIPEIATQLWKRDVGLAGGDEVEKLEVLHVGSPHGSLEVRSAHRQQNSGIALADHPCQSERRHRLFESAGESDQIVPAPIVGFEGEAQEKRSDLPQGLAAWRKRVSRRSILRRVTLKYFESQVIPQASSPAWSSPTARLGRSASAKGMTTRATLMARLAGRSVCESPSQGITYGGRPVELGGEAAQDAGGDLDLLFGLRP